MRRRERNNSADTRPVKKEGEKVLEMPEQRLPLQLVLKTIVRQAVPLQPMEVHGGADYPPVAHRRDPMPEQVDA